MYLKQRKRVFWEWSDSSLHCRCHDGLLNDGGQMDVQVRTSATGAVQLFVGAYFGSGEMMFEEYYKSRPGETMTQALEWGVNRAMILTSTKLIPLPSTARLGVYRRA
ncbi:MULTISPECIES: hypothetical protein [unclassified Pseudomonas]|uniref:hypothetical protein n=1 Tax=unclassified Pseudomonas TaxID=196821 RepID=UPI001012CC89|nr:MULTISPECIES: hypothetical protein [unclassified Pseudomonas]KAA0983265.1 hypothetical protein FQ187_12680 [Pseudomonas sp. ANT_J28]QAY93701.1 hypothetical protein CUN63_29530 [Pseudomonas sp. ACM7]